MTLITDIPQSGVYFQQGAIVQLVVQIVDVNTGLPVQLQTATGLSISILYPDRVTVKTVAATLFTDGSDGMIVYTTVNNGTTIDLSQIGLYEMQGIAAIGGSVTVLSYQTDCYVLPNPFSNSSPAPAMSASAMIFYDPNGVRWALTVSPSGLQAPALQPSGPSSYIFFNTVVLQDSDGVYWTASMSITGVLTWTSGGSFVNALESFVLIDSNNRSWLCTISTSGVLVAS